jgi:hypothetical protein
MYDGLFEIGSLQWTDEFAQETSAVIEPHRWVAS